jgi:hypothetical protein
LHCRTIGAGRLVRLRRQDCDLHCRAVYFLGALVVGHEVHVRVERDEAAERIVVQLG